jgi:ketopantoate reductase
MSNEFDVVVIGGGPVGLWLACELALAKVKVLVLERRTERVTQSRALTIHGRSQRVAVAGRSNGQALANGLVVRRGAHDIAELLPHTSNGGHNETENSRGTVQLLNTSDGCLDGRISGRDFRQGAQQCLLATRHGIEGRGRYPRQGGDIVHFGRKITALAEQPTRRPHDRLPRCLRILLAAAHSDG